MPLLPLEPCVYPDELFAEPARDVDARWWVLHARPRAEKTLARRLHRQRVRFFLPLYERRHRHQGRVRSAYLPLFPGYLFLRGDWDDRRSALETNLVAHCLEVTDQGELHDNLADVHRLMTSEAELTPESRLRPGMPVEIIAGPFAGMTGKVERRRNKVTFAVEIRLLQQGVSMEIASWMIEPLGQRLGIVVSG